MIKKLNVVVVGGGTGLSNLLKGLKHFPVNLTAIVSVADDGGSTGRLRDDFDMPAPGDVRNVMVSLSKKETLIEDLFQYRFTEGELKGHCLGNIMLAGMLGLTGSMTKATATLSQILDLHGEVIPVSNQSLDLCAKLENGDVLEGESVIGNRGKGAAKIDNVFYKKKAVASRKAIRAIKQADVIIFGIGSLYTSIAPNLIIEGIRREISKSKAEKIYICNIMQQPGETVGYSAADHVKTVEKHLGDKMDTVIVNNRMKIDSNTMQKYLDDGVDLVSIDRQSLQGYNLIEKDLVKIDNGYIRHNFLKLGMEIYSYLLEKIQEYDTV